MDPELPRTPSAMSYKINSVSQQSIVVDYDAQEDASESQKTRK